tara:strand:+ start:172982 stop:173083 length:102 start_codon:yes stop_codon:yes gene_type:complete
MLWNMRTPGKPFANKFHQFSYMQQDTGRESGTL